MAKKRSADERRAERRRYYEAHAEELRQKQREYRKANPQRVKAGKRDHYLRHRSSVILKSRLWELSNPEKKRANNRKRSFAVEYGITLDDFERMMDLQGGQCAICPAKLTSHRDTHVDHNHKTGKVRALLCPRCNIALGVVESKGAIWLGLAKCYLEQFESSSILETEYLWRADWSDVDATSVTTPVPPPPSRRKQLGLFDRSKA